MYLLTKWTNLHKTSYLQNKCIGLSWKDTDLLRENFLLSDHQDPFWCMDSLTADCGLQILTSSRVVSAHWKWRSADTEECCSVVSSHSVGPHCVAPAWGWYCHTPELAALCHYWASSASLEKASPTPKPPQSPTYTSQRVTLLSP